MRERWRRILSAAWPRARRGRLFERPWRDGAPPGVPAAVVAAWAQRLAGNADAAVAHRHLSGWKSAGTYRLSFVAGTRRVTAICKIARYGSGDAPGLEGLGMRPGPPELVVYGAEHPALRAWLPEVYAAEEVEPGVHFRYLLEDLDRGWRECAARRDLLSVCAALPRLHAALDAALAGAARARLPEVGRAFGDRVLVLAHERLVARDGARAAPLRACWADVDRAWADGREEVAGARPIHGDLNPTNVLLGGRRTVVLDWEWAGLGAPEADLAALLKREGARLEARCVQRYADAAGADRSAVRRRFEACKLQRGLLDAVFWAGRDGTRELAHAVARACAAAQALRG